MKNKVISSRQDKVECISDTDPGRVHDREIAQIGGIKHRKIMTRIFRDREDHDGDDVFETASGLQNFRHHYRQVVA